MATIDYLAKGGDYMKAFREGDGVADSPTWVYDDLLEYFTTGRRCRSAAHRRPRTALEKTMIPGGFLF